MNEAHAQTAEIIGAGSEAVSRYNDQAGVAAGTAMIFCAILLAILYFMFRRLEKRDQEIADLRAAHEKVIGEMKVTCALEIAKAKSDAEADAEESKKIAWQRVTEIFNSVTILFGKCDTSNLQVANTLKNLQITLASKGIVSRD